MAYAFEKIMNQMGDDKNDIFGGDQQGQQGGQQNFAGAGGETKSTAEGDVSSGGGGAGGNVQKSNFVAQSNQNAGAQRAYEAAKAQPSSGSSFAPMTQVSEKLGKAQSDLQSEANSYLKTGKDKQNYDVSQDNIEKAIAGDETARGSVSKTLSQSAPTPVEAWVPKTDYNVEEIENFKSTPGVTGYLRSQFGPQYTAGQSQFDANRLRSDPNFYNSLRSLEGRQQDLTKQADAYGAQDTGLAAQVQSAGKANLEASQAAIRRYLDSQQGALAGSNETEYQKYIADLAAAKANPAAAAQAGLAASDANTRIGQVRNERKDLSKYLTPEAMAAFGIDPSKYVDFADTSGLSADSFYDQGEASRFNNIRSLLGQGGSAKAAGILPASQSNFRTDSYLGDIFGAAESANAKADDAAKLQVKTIEDKLRGLLDSQNNVPDAKNWAIPAFGEAARSAGYQGNFDPNLVDINQYFTRDPITQNPFDYATEADAQALNSAYDELMNPTRIQAGNRMGRPNYAFNQSGYKDAVMAALEAKMRAQTPPPPAPDMSIKPGPAQRETSPQEVFQEFGKIVPGIKKGVKDMSKAVGRMR